MVGSSRSLEFSNEKNMREDEKGDKNTGDNIELVVFSENDPEDPKNWSTQRKLTTVVILCVLSFCGVFGSSVYAPGEAQVRGMFNVNAEVASTGLTVYVLGFAFGPLLWPLSEMYGRRLPYLISWPLLAVVIAPSAWVNNIIVIMIFRLLTGIFSACALNNGGGIINDLYGTTPRTLQKAIGWYAFCPLSGPVIGSLVGFFIAAHLTHGLWVIRIHWFFVLAVLPLALFVPETHGPTILMRRAKQLRRNGHPRAFATHELHSKSKSEVLRSNMGRPIMMLLMEPIVMGAAAWISVAYSIIYLFFETFPVVFVEQNHIPFQLGGLPFIGITLGMILCVTTMDRATQLSKHVRIPFVDPPGGRTPVDAPEAGLKVVLLACLFMPASMFWFAWTSKGNVHWISPTLAGIPFGYAMLSVFYSFVGYTSRIYSVFGSSALAANTLARSIVASIFPIIAHPILNNLGTAWGVSIFGFLSVALIPVPIIFVRYGPILRSRSHFAREADRVVQGMRHQKATPPAATDVDNTSSQAPTETNDLEAARTDNKASEDDKSMQVHVSATEGSVVAEVVASESP